MPADPATRDAALARVRAHCLALPQTHERTSHGAQAFYVGPGRGRGFVTFLDDHHRDGRLALWCAAPTGAQEAYVTQSPAQYFVPPYVGHRGWLGVRLDRDLPWEEIAGAIEDAYVAIAPRKLLEQLPPAG
ncbi:MAG: hypothetical protein JWQ48_1153 [Conexibacter sp.]|jgi:hypothetical protein|nr:hypothetical protein [Conexibacter sp.]